MAILLFALWAYVKYGKEEDEPEFVGMTRSEERRAVAQAMAYDKKRAKMNKGKGRRYGRYVIR